MGEWRTAKCIDTLRDQCNAMWPKRSKGEDGTIGDARHQAEHSEHNPDANGVVRAIDISHDPDHGLNADVLAHALIDSRDPRILYVISRKQICSSVVQPWIWRPYKGSDPHTGHLHLSVVAVQSKYDDKSPWKIAGTPVAKLTPKAPAVQKPAVTQPVKQETNMWELSSILSLLPSIMRVVTPVRTAIQTGLSFKNVFSLFDNPDVQSFFKTVGAKMFPDVHPDLQASAAAVVHYAPDYVKWVQNATNALTGSQLDVDGHYGDLTKAAVKKLQGVLKLDVIDGWAGDVTKAAIAAALVKVSATVLATPVPAHPTA